MILKDLQRHPARPRILHADFQRVSRDRKIHVHIPLHFINQEKCHGVKNQGGMIQHNANEVHVSCLPQDLPEYIEVDLSGLTAQDTIKVRDLKLPAGVKAVLKGKENPVVVSVTIQGAAQAEEEAVAATPAAEVPAIAQKAPPAAAAAPAEKKGGEKKK